MIIGNGIVITNDKDNNVYDCGAVYINDNIIEDTGDFEEIKKKYPDEQVVDVQGKVIMPGMTCLHTHIYSSYARGMAASKPTDNFFNVLENLWWSLDRKLTSDDVRINGLCTMIESIRCGVTTIMDHHSGPNSVEGSLFTLRDAAKEIGMRGTYCVEVSDRDGKEKADKAIKENIDFIKACQKDDLGDMVHGLFGMHASFTISDETMEKCREAMEGVYDGYHVHVAEGIEDEYDSMKKYNKRIVERLQYFDILGENTLAIHNVHVNPKEIKILEDTNTKAVFNPESNMNNAVGCGPIPRMLKEGILVGLGTDAYTNDMFESMKVANILMAHETHDPTVGFMETIDLQFKNNPKILKQYFSKPLGVLEKGAYADIITLNYKYHTPLTKDSWYGHSLFGFSGGLVNDTMINGKFVMRDREITTIDADKVYAESRKATEHIWPYM